MSEIDLTLLPDYIVEATEHLDEMETLLLNLEQDPSNTEILNDIFRPIHTIKGSAQYIGLERVSTLSHRMEDLLDLLRQGKRESNDEILELLIEGRDRIVTLNEELSEFQEERSQVDDLVAELTRAIEGELEGEGTEAAPSAAAADSDEAQNSDGDEFDLDEFSAVMAQDAADASTEVYSEEYDQELFDIFVDNLREKYRALSGMVDHIMDAEDKAPLIEQSMEYIDNLESAAKYMGYDPLAAMFEEWSDTLEEAKQVVADSGEFSPEFLTSYLQRIESHFPQVKQEGDLAASDYTAQSATATEEPEREDISDSVMAAFAEAEADDEEAEEEPSDIDMSLLPDFITEAEEHLEEMESMLIQLEQSPDNLELLNDIFRPIHTIKGAAQYLGLQRISKLAHRLEDLLDLLRKEELKSSDEIADLLINGRDRIHTIVSELQSQQSEQSQVDDLTAHVDRIIQGGGGDQETPAPATAASGDGEPDSVQQKLAYDEAHDQELFDIFIQHLTENFTQLLSLADALDSGSNSAEVLQQCSEVIEGLRSSANYMGYGELTEIYRDLTDELIHQQQRANTGNAISSDFLHQHLNRLTELFPNLKELKGDSSQVHVSQQTPAQPQEPVVPDASPSGDIELEQEYSDEDELFDRLSSAMESSLHTPQGSSEYETLQEVFDEMVSTRKGGEKKPPLKPATPAAKAPKEAPAPAAKPAAAKPAPGPQKPAPQAAEQGKEQKRKPVAPSSRRDTESKPAPTAEQPKQRGGASERIFKKSVRVDAEKIDTLMNQVGELVVDRSYFFQLFNEMRHLQNYLKDTLGMGQKELKEFRSYTYKLGEAIGSLSRTTNELQEGVMKVRMLPISQLFNRYPRLIHDLTRNTAKKVNLDVKGEDTELDKMIVEELSDPLIHIIRNSVDHGIETVTERKKLGKPESANLLLEAYQESNHIVIEVTDDGRGIDPVKVKTKALEKGLLTQEELDRMTDKELIWLVTQPGFSTADKITGTSGRGVGMDVVKKNIEKLNGTLEIESKLGAMTQVRLKIPLTLAIISALLVRVGKDMFTIPLANVEETIRIYEHDTSVIEGTEVIHLRGKTLPIFRLSNLFNIDADTEGDKTFVVVVNTGAQPIGLVVDELMGQDEVVIKPLVDYLQEQSGFSGATIIGDGRISLILDVYELLNMTINRQMKFHQQQNLARRKQKGD